jgi:hypothetical protein
MIPLQKPVARNQTVAWVRYTGFRGGFPHSEICGSKVVRTSPQLIAAYHVLHRLLPPRHPRNALKSLDCSHYQCPLGSGIIDHKKTRSCEIDPRAARLSAAALRRPRVGPQAYPFFTMVRSDIRRTCTAQPVKQVLTLFADRWTSEALVEPDGIEPTTSSLQS